MKQDVSNIAPVKAVVFDCDGTLVDSEYAHYSAWRQVLLEQNYDLSLEEYHFYAGNPDPVCAECFYKKLASKSPEKMVEEKNQHFHKIQVLGLPPIQPTVDFVRLLFQKKQKLHLKLGVASAAPKTEILLNLKHLKIEECFDIILSGHEDLTEYADPEGVNKPKPYIYLHAAKLLGLVPRECVAVEDSYTGVSAAVRAGFITIAIPNRFTLSHDLSQAALKLESFEGSNVDQFFQLLTQAEI